MVELSEDQSGPWTPKLVIFLMMCLFFLSNHIWPPLYSWPSSITAAQTWYRPPWRRKPGHIDEYVQGRMTKVCCNPDPRGGCGSLDEVAMVAKSSASLRGIASPEPGHKTVPTVCHFPSSRQESSPNFVIEVITN